MNYWANKALHRTAIPLYSIAAGEFCRYAAPLFNLALQLLSQPSASPPCASSRKCFTTHPNRSHRVTSGRR